MCAHRAAQAIAEDMGNNAAESVRRVRLTDICFDFDGHCRYLHALWTMALPWIAHWISFPLPYRVHRILGPSLSTSSCGVGLTDGSYSPSLCRSRTAFSVHTYGLRFPSCLHTLIFPATRAPRSPILVPACPT